MKYVKFIAWLTVVNVVLLIFLTSAGAQSAPSLFQASVTQVARDAVNKPTVKRSRPVSIRFDIVANADGSPRLADRQGESLTLNLFDGMTFEAIRDRVESNPSRSFSWIGHLKDVPLSEVILVVKDNIMVGHVAMPGGVYEIRYEGGDVHIVSELDQAAFPEDQVMSAEMAPPAPSPDAVPLAEADSGTTIDVMVVYTQNARIAAGSATAMQNLIDQAITTTNQGYANSQITQRVRLVHSAEVSYTETGDMCNADLDSVTGTTDGTIDNVHTLRDQYGADEVVLLLNDALYANSCGCAWVMSSPSSAFAVVADSCAVGNLSFPHEMGHNMGALHDWYVDSDTYPYTYAHGYINTTARWRTIMAYNNQCSASGFYCTRLNYWSNPNISYNGAPMGVTEGQSNPADNHRTLNNTAYSIANFRQSTVADVNYLLWTK